MYKVKNITKHARKYRDNKQGRDIIIQPGKFVETTNPPTGTVWKITDIEKEKEKNEANIEKKEKTKLNTQEVKNGSSSSRRCMDGDMLDSNIERGRK